MQVSPTYSNQLKNVSDAISSGNTIGFVDGNTNPALDDYEYDANDFRVKDFEKVFCEETERSSMVKDRNKGIASITYNYLNLPELIIFENSNSIEYTYNAAGVKLKKTVIEETATPEVRKEVDYLDGFQYAGEVLNFFPTAEGYVRATPTGNITPGSPPTAYAYNYVFNYTDHLGNIRLSYTLNPQNNKLEILEENHYFPFGLKHSTYIPADKKMLELIVKQNEEKIKIKIVQETEYQYKFGQKEYQDELNLNVYDFGARNYDPAIGRWMNPDPLTEQAPDWTPYRYGFNNPIRYTDPTGMFEGDFIDENGKYLGNDGIDDGKVYVVKTTQKSFASGAPSAGISKSDAKATKDFIKNNSGNTEAFQNNSIAYDNSVEIVGSSETRQAMVDIVNQDNGRGGTSDSNNREYGGSINRDGTVTQAPAGAVGNPLENSNVSITLTTTFENQSTFHSHPSGTRTEGNTTGSWAQPPSYKGGDVQVSGSALNYVFGRGNGTIYIYNNKGVQATIPQKHFVNPKK